MLSLNLPHNPRIDEIRWLAASLVFFFHFYHHVYAPPIEVLAHPGWTPFSLVTEGHTGVGLFFTLSGFLFMQIALYQAEQRKGLVYREFIRNRFLRIFPLFITVFVIAISIGRDAFRPQDALYVLFSNLGESPTSKYFITGAAWTISVEFAFYLVFPFIARFTLAQGPRYLLQCLGLMLAFKLAAYGVSERSTHMLFSTLVGRFDQFLVGMLAAVVHARFGQELRRHGKVWLLLAALLVTGNIMLQARYASFFLPEPKQAFWITWSLQESLAWSVFILGWLAADLRLPRPLARAMQHGGDISFSLYLLHALVIDLVAQALGKPSWTGQRIVDGLLLAAIAYAATWAVSSLSYATIEKPFLQLRRRYAQ
ncbi:acyltransferase family protein [Noviherbaspirillum galbum]|uniref:Acyltransferase n=1 Tax=Noviherbaspirillum galbum TaxID=2709383 RepID=A0A6B3SR56_9BURK|nr:acyltransferase [Noviherbaspirillum galbum]NEX60892.1 acyltransferase [Noviherbaspirillum galbum]